MTAPSPSTITENSALILDIFNYQINLASVLIVLCICGLVFTFWKIQSAKRLDFADMLTKDGTKVSTTKVLQLVGGIVASWVIIKTGSAGTLSAEMFAIYLAYVGSIEGWSKFISAKYNYNEMSIKSREREKQNLGEKDIDIDKQYYDRPPKKFVERADDQDNY